MRKIANLKENIMEILKNKREKLRLNGIVIDVVKDNEEEYYIILEKEKYWASIVIANPYCAPYKNVSFEIYRVSDAKIISFYYDNENTTFQENIEKIDEIMKITAELERRNADGDKKAEEELEKWSKDIEELDIKF